MRALQSIYAWFWRLLKCGPTALPVYGWARRLVKDGPVTLFEYIAFGLLVMSVIVGAFLLFAVPAFFYMPVMVLTNPLLGLLGLIVHAGIVAGVWCYISDKLGIKPHAVRMRELMESRPPAPPPMPPMPPMPDIHTPPRPAMKARVKRD